MKSNVIKLKSFSGLKRRILQDKKIRTAYEKLGPEFALIESIIEKRLKKGMSQATLAQKIGTKQSAIARLESGSYNPSVAFLDKVAKALDADLTISLSK
ncbi:helix-turn-helix transcriptional regulator [Patescibacteria group bacterium]|nr:helix-turn-helix transcriptional regulator [Patescibacteria group bacterium]MBU1034303.1 helix-turn-helix transcriptional regulator [Patescibacteria group bacterium]MBU1629513.1 helix-turn-helix transcriptional regulator [Patescibacteria group bacterium]MBU1907540.1 helix-turn-helix transcriptional regulator [Patescibacteria group bacterium]